MRVWDIDPKYLCDKHLLGEHQEIHAIWVILTQNKKGYRNHPETRRWKTKLKALYLRHEKDSNELTKRGFQHKSFLDKRLAKGEEYQDKFINSTEEQKLILNNKQCNCCFN